MSSHNAKEDTLSRLPRWVNTALVILVGYALAVLSLKAISQTEVRVAALSNSQSTGRANPTNIDLVSVGQTTAATHLFGNKAEKVEDKRQAPSKPRPATVDLKLAGVFAYEPQERAIAIIVTKQGEEAFRVGDVIENRITLKAVFTDRIIIDNNGKDEEIRLPENVTPIASRRPEPTQAASANNNGGDTASNGPVDLPTSPGALRDTLAKNPALLGRVVAAEPYQENGKLLGYRITPKQNPEILEAQGIVAGDIITRVNNIQLNSQKQGIRALRNAVKAQNLDVTVLRDGVEVPLSISLTE